MHGISLFTAATYIDGIKLFAMLPKMTEVFSCVPTHVLATEEQPIHLILLFSYSIHQEYINVFLDACRSICAFRTAITSRREDNSLC